MNKKVFLLILSMALISYEFFADKNFFTTLGGGKPFWQTRDTFIKAPNYCNTMFEPGHPEAFEPNKTFLTFYGDSLGDPDNRIPMPFLVIAREKAFAIRQKVNEELIARGVNHL
jgi:hypothetical protein